jgi:hypothetical protein
MPKEKIFIPAGKNNKYQPLDVKIHGPLKSSGKKLCKEQFINGSNEVNLNESLIHLDNAIKTVVTTDLIIKSFVESLNL